MCILVTMRGMNNGWISIQFIFSVLVLSIRSIWPVYCNIVNLMYCIISGPYNNLYRALHCVLLSALSHFHRPFQRSLSVFPFQILLAFLLMTQSLSVLRRHSFVLVGLESCIFCVCLWWFREGQQGNVLLRGWLKSIDISTFSVFSLVNSVSK